MAEIAQDLAAVGAFGQGAAGGGSACQPGQIGGQRIFRPRGKGEKGHPGGAGLIIHDAQGNARQAGLHPGPIQHGAGAIAVEGAAAARAVRDGDRAHGGGGVDQPARRLIGADPAILHPEA